MPAIRRLLPVALVAASLAALVTRAVAQPAQQGVLGPGLYVFQTRIDHATCGDAERTGEVTSYYAAVDGIPASRTMRMGLLNSRFWPEWTLTVTPGDRVIGEAVQAGVTGPDRGVSRFDLVREGNRFVGRGTREYTRVVDGAPTRCRVAYDALLRQLDR